MTRFRFGDFELDADAGRLTRGSETLSVPARHLEVLAALLTHAGQVVSKDTLVEAAWRDVAVTDNSLEQAISSLRRVLVSNESPIQTVPRQGYRFNGSVERLASRASDDTLDALMAPFRAFVEGRAALESLSADGVVEAVRAFERVLAASPENPAAHVGMATAHAMRFETTRADPAPAFDALAAAASHAREACRLDPQYGEAWATLGFVLDRTGAGVDAVAALSRAVSLEPDNWRHHLRLAAVSWGEARLRAARRTLALLPGCPLAHWLAATVHVARRALDEAERELVAGCAALAKPGSETRFSGVALEWLLGLIRLSRGDATGAQRHFDRELAAESDGHLYARECCANVWYAIGAMRWHEGDGAAANEAFAQALRRVEGHPLASIMAASPVAGPRASAVEIAVARIVAIARAREPVDDAVAALDAALAAAPTGSAGWILPVEPLLRPSGAGWEPVFAKLRSRAA
jgi:DNA-binding winged helix-turn-helix (wHTH) protein